MSPESPVALEPRVDRDAAAAVADAQRERASSAGAIHIRRPTGALAPFIDTIWYYHAGDFAHERERILPTGSMQLLINLYEDELRTYTGEGYRSVERMSGAGLCGAYSEHFAIDTREQLLIAGVSFRVAGAFPFFRPPADAVAGAHVPLGTLWGRAGASLRERLLEAQALGTSGARGTSAALGASACLDASAAAELILDTLERELLARVVRPLEVDAGIAFAVRAFDLGAPVAAVAARFGGSSRHFQRTFAEQVGLTPKRFSRVRRFRRVLESIELGRPLDWAQVAIACGYFDQAHLINDFREFSGLTPTAYQPRSPDERSHVPLRDDPPA